MKLFKFKTNKQRVTERFIASGFLRLKKIKVLPGKFNNPTYCQDNARQALEDGSAKKIAEVIYISSNSKRAIVHYVEKKGKSYIDNTLGYYAKGITYYLIREFTLKDLENKTMTNVINGAKKDILKKLFTPLEIKIYRFKPSDL